MFYCCEVFIKAYQSDRNTCRLYNILWRAPTLRKKSPNFKGEVDHALVTINEFRPTRNKRFNFLVRIYALGGDGDVNYCPRLADDSVVSDHCIKINL